MLLAQLRSEVSHLAKLVCIRLAISASTSARIRASAMADVSGILFRDGQCLSLWVRYQRLRYHVGRCTSCSLLTTVPNSSSHNSCVPPPEAKSHRRKQQCAAMMCFDSTSDKSGSREKGSQQHLRRQKRHCCLPDPCKQRSQHRPCRVIEMMRRVGESVLRS